MIGATTEKARLSKYNLDWEQNVDAMKMIKK